MKLRKILSLTVIASLLMAGFSLTFVPTYADGDVTEFTEDFEGYTAGDNYANTLDSLMSNGWYWVNENTVFTDTSANPYTAFTSGLQVVTTDGKKCLQLDTPNANKSNNNYGIGRYFPGQGTAASGVWEINFKFKSYYSGSSKVQFNFSMNTADGSASSGTNAQHNIVSAYDNKMYLGYRNYLTLYNNKIAQGTVSNAIQPTWWFDVKAIVNCDAKYYSVEVSHDGDLVARRSPVSFAGDETIGFLKLSALGMGNAHRIWVDDISIEKTSREALIYEDGFDEYTLTTLASTGMTTGSSSEVYTGDSYFKYNTPWRYNTSVGNSYAFENDETLSSKVVRLGDLASTSGTTEASGLVYMQAGENLVTQSTEPLRGFVKTSFKIKPETIVDDVTVNAIPSVNYDITSSSCEFFNITYNDGAPKLSKGGGEYVPLDPSKWYKVELTFYVVNRAVVTTVTDIATGQVVSFSQSGSSTPNAVKAIMYKVSGGSSVLMDDIRIEYYVPVPAGKTGTDYIRIRSVTTGGETLRTLSDIAPGSTINVAFEYENNRNKPAGTTAVLAFYSGSRLTKIDTQSATVEADSFGTDDTSLAFTVPAGFDMNAVDKMSVFLWDGFDNLKPQSRKKEYVKKDAITDEFDEYVDFVVNVESGRDAVVLQLTDPQIIDSNQVREGVQYSLQKRVFWMPELMDERLFNDLDEVIEATDPDLILLTGDLVYGGYDDAGTSFVRLADFIDGYDIPWAPVFGNHDNETKRGVDWQCDYLENCDNCLFKQRTLTGNGNYSIGIVQGGELKRVIFMMDSNGCGAMSDESYGNGHSQKAAGFGSDQIAWYTAAANNINGDFNDVKYTFAFHIQPAVFEDALYNTYGFVNGGEVDANKNLVEPLNIDERPDKRSTDFGYIGRSLKGPWDTDKTVYAGMKALGADSILVGHEHCNNASVVYDGIRFQYGQKIGEYDRINFRAQDGSIIGFIAIETSKGTPILGGTVLELSESTGEISNAYIYYCDRSNNGN